MKILHINFALCTGGAESLIVDIVNNQIKTQQVYLLIINNEYDSSLIANINKRVKLYFLNRQPGSRNISIYFKLNLIIHKVRPDVIHCHDYNIGPIVFLPFRKKLYLTAHDVNFPISKIKSFKKIFAVSECVKENIEKRSNLIPIVIPNGIKMENIKWLETSNQFDIFRIVMVSRLDHKKKGQHLLLEALSKVVHEYNHTKIHVDLIGTGDSEKYLKDLTTQLELNNYVSFKGNMDRQDIYDCLCTYQLLIQPSIYEGFGLTVIEAMAAKVPVLVSNIDGPYEIIEKGKYGEWFENGSSDSCAKKIEYIINNYSKVNSKATIAQKQVEKLYSIDSTTRNYLNNYLMESE